jgi:hypothetical protein
MAIETERFMITDRDIARIKWADIQVSTLLVSNGFENGGKLNDQHEGETKFPRSDRQLSLPCSRSKNLGRFLNNLNVSLRNDCLSIKSREGLTEEIIFFRS